MPLVHYWGGAMTQEGRIRRRFRQSRVVTVELLIMVLLAGTLLGACERSTPESGSAARPGSTPEPDSGADEGADTGA